MSDQAAFLRAYRLPGRIDATTRKLATLKAEYHGVKSEVILKRIELFDTAWEQAILTAKREAQENGEEWSMGVDHV